ncbi:unnamed protein product [Amoebophrya sp. A120]|nr:unnamed protein product [Amoebophrya sp. A120]|eukprot:GSA120T00011137001.1
MLHSANNLSSRKRPRVWAMDVDELVPASPAYAKWIYTECKKFAKTNQHELDLLRKRIDLEHIFDEPLPEGSKVFAENKRIGAHVMVNSKEQQAASRGVLAKRKTTSNSSPTTKDLNPNRKLHSRSLVSSSSSSSSSSAGSGTTFTGAAGVRAHMITPDSVTTSRPGCPVDLQSFHEYLERVEKKRTSVTTGEEAINTTTSGAKRQKRFTLFSTSPMARTPRDGNKGTDVHVAKNFLDDDEDDEQKATTLQPPTEPTAPKCGAGGNKRKTTFGGFLRSTITRAFPLPPGRRAEAKRETSPSKGNCASDKSGKVLSATRPDTTQQEEAKNEDPDSVSPADSSDDEVLKFHTPEPSENKTSSWKSSRRAARDSATTTVEVKTKKMKLEKVKAQAADNTTITIETGVDKAAAGSSTTSCFSTTNTGPASSSAAIDVQQSSTQFTLDPSSSSSGGAKQTAVETPDVEMIETIESHALAATQESDWQNTTGMKQNAETLPLADKKTQHQADHPTTPARTEEEQQHDKKDDAEKSEPIDTFPPRYSVTGKILDEDSSATSLQDRFCSMAKQKRKMKVWGDLLELHKLCEKKANQGVFLIHAKENVDGMLSCQNGGAPLPVPRNAEEAMFLQNLGTTPSETIFNLQYSTLRHYLCGVQGFPEENVTVSTERDERQGKERYIEWHLTKPGQDEVKENIRKETIRKNGGEEKSLAKRLAVTEKFRASSEDEKNKTIFAVDDWQRHLREKVGRVQLRVWFQGIQPRHKLKQCPTDVFEYILSFLSPGPDVIMNPLYLYTICADHRDEVYYQVSAHILSTLVNQARQGETTSTIDFRLIEDNRLLAAAEGARVEVVANYCAGNSRDWKPMVLKLGWIKAQKDVEYMAVSIMAILKSKKMGFECKLVQGTPQRPQCKVEVNWDPENRGLVNRAAEAPAVENLIQRVEEPRIAGMEPQV